MIVFAADYVGYELVKWLVDSDIAIETLVYDENDHGNTRDRILSLVSEKSTRVFSSEDLKSNTICRDIKSQGHEIGFLLWWPYILTEDQIALTKRGFVNTHPAFLPYNRGKHPYFWSMVENTKFGVTLHWITPGIDDGPIIAQREIPISWVDTGETLYNKSREEIIDLFIESFQGIINGDLVAINQSDVGKSIHYGNQLDPFCEIHIDDCYVAADLLNRIRGRMFNGKGNAYFFSEGKKYYISINIREEE